MKMKEETLKRLEEVINATFEENQVTKEEAERVYKQAGHSHERFRWDVFHSCGLSNALYDEGINDNHIDTALRSILGKDYK